MLHVISDQYPIYLTVSKARLKWGIEQRFFRDTRIVDITAFDRDLHVTLDSLPTALTMEWQWKIWFYYVVAETFCGH